MQSLAETISTALDAVLPNGFVAKASADRNSVAITSPDGDVIEVGVGRIADQHGPAKERYLVLAIESLLDNAQDFITRSLREAWPFESGVQGTTHVVYEHQVIRSGYMGPNGWMIELETRSFPTNRQD